MRVVATAGHVDHGKSTLVRALTGMDPDRLAEEKARGLTIDLGFAWSELPTGQEVAFVDVPGHVRFLKNMLAGVGAVDACLFVVAANEGWKPQSEEHLRILDLLDVDRGVVAVTKSALVEPPALAAVVAEVRGYLKGSALAEAPLVTIDAPTGAGLDGLATTLGRVLSDAPEAPDRGRARLWIDRSFAVPGTGAVVTGTLIGGSVAVGDELQIVPGAAKQPHPRTVRVRSIQTQKRSRERIGPGNRVALGLTGAGQDRVSHRQLGRGQAVVRADRWALTAVVDASLEVLEAAPGPVGRRGAYLAYLGSGEFNVGVRVLGATSVRPGQHGTVRLRLPMALPLEPGDRYVLRDVGRSVTVGGGAILDVAPVLPVSKARPDRSVERVVAERGWVEVGELERLTGTRRPPTLAGRWVVDPDVLASTTAALLAGIDEAGPQGLDHLTVDERERAVLSELEERGEVTVVHGRVRRPGQLDGVADHPYVAALDAAPFAPPDPVTLGVDRVELRQLVLSGRVVERDGHYFSAQAVRRASLAIAELLDQHPEGVTVSLVRERLGTTRKHVVPLLNLLDAQGVTRRRGDLRIGGPRLVDAGDPEPKERR